MILINSLAQSKEKKKKAKTITLVMNRKLAPYLRYSNNIMACFYLLHDKGSGRSCKYYFSCHGRTKYGSVNIVLEYMLDSVQNKIRTMHAHILILEDFN